MKKLNNSLQQYIKYGTIVLVVLLGLRLLMANSRRNQVVKEISSPDVFNNVPPEQVFAARDGITDVNDIAKYTQLIDWLDQNCPENRNAISIVAVSTKLSYKEILNEDMSNYEAMRIFAERVPTKKSGKNCISIAEDIHKELKETQR